MFNIDIYLIAIFVNFYFSSDLNAGAKRQAQIINEA